MSLALATVIYYRLGYQLLAFAVCLGGATEPDWTTVHLDALGGAAVEADQLLLRGACCASGSSDKRGGCRLCLTRREVFKPQVKSSDVSDSQEVESGIPLNLLLLPMDPMSSAVGLFVVFPEVDNDFFIFLVGLKSKSCFLRHADSDWTSDRSRLLGYYSISDRLCSCCLQIRVGAAGGECSR